jgi:hypothetical protein
MLGKHRSLSTTAGFEPAYWCPVVQRCHVPEAAEAAEERHPRSCRRQQLLIIGHRRTQAHDTQRLERHMSE